MSDKFQPAGPPSHKGLLHKKLGVPEGEKIPQAKLEKAAHSPNVKLEREANFALVQKHWHHGASGK